MANQDEIIKQHIRESRIKKLKYIIPAALVFLLIMAVSIQTHLDPEVEIETITGVLESINHEQDSAGFYTDVFVVRLDDNQVIDVSVDIDSGIPFHQGSRVEVEKSTKNTGAVSYAFTRYLEK